MRRWTNRASIPNPLVGIATLIVLVAQDILMLWIGDFL
jgi:hypothetical protein